MGVSLGFNLTVFYLPGRKPLHYYLCANMDPTPDLALPHKSGSLLEWIWTFLFLYCLLFLGFIDLFSLMIHLLVKSRIMIYKKARVRNFPTFSEGLGLMDFATQSCFLCVFIVFLTLQIKVNSLTIDELNHYPGDIYMYSLILLGPCLIFFIVSTFEYLRNKAMRDSLLNEISNRVSCNFRERTFFNT